MATVHINANEGDIAKTVLMPGDPLRAKFIAEHYLSDVTCYNQVRNMLGFTGKYKGVRVSVQGSGMGIPSMGIYSRELYHDFGVDNIIRIGTIGGLQETMTLGETVFAMSCITDSTYYSHFEIPCAVSPAASWELLQKAIRIAEEKQNKYCVGSVLTTDAFYDQTGNLKRWKELGVVGVEMETAALYINAMLAKKNALGIFSVSDFPFGGAAMSAAARERSLSEMIETALELAIIL